MFSSWYFLFSVAHSSESESMFHEAKPSLKETMPSEMVPGPEGVGILLVPLQTVIKGSLSFSNEEFDSLLLQTSIGQNSFSLFFCLYHKCHDLGQSADESRLGSSA